MEDKLKDKVFCCNCEYYTTYLKESVACGQYPFTCDSCWFECKKCNSPKNVKHNYETGEKTENAKHPSELNRNGDCKYYKKGNPKIEDEVLQYREQKEYEKQQQEKQLKELKELNDGLSNLEKIITESKNKNFKNKIKQFINKLRGKA